jgi:hypothetical protein
MHEHRCAGHAVADVAAGAAAIERTVRILRGHHGLQERVVRDGKIITAPGAAGVEIHSMQV